jgi:hypothetical protein
MRLVSEYTKVVATSFGGNDGIVCRLTARVAAKEKDLAGQMVMLDGTNGAKAIALLTS